MRNRTFLVAMIVLFLAACQRTAPVDLGEDAVALREQARARTEPSAIAPASEASHAGYPGGFAFPFAIVDVEDRTVQRRDGAWQRRVSGVVDGTDSEQALAEISSAFSDVGARPGRPRREGRTVRINFHDEGEGSILVVLDPVGTGDAGKGRVGILVVWPLRDGVAASANGQDFQDAR